MSQDGKIRESSFPLPAFGILFSPRDAVSP
jgi:hypothetical protein